MQFFNTAIPDGSITTAKIVDLAVTTAKIAAQAVTNDKLAGPRFKSTISDVDFTFVPDANATITAVFLQAGGGGGAGCAATGAGQCSLGQPGESGELIIGIFTPTQIGASVDVTIGAAGAAGVAAAGGDGGNSSFGTLMSAYHGAGGGSDGPTTAYAIAGSNPQSFGSGTIAFGTGGLPWTMMQTGQYPIFGYSGQTVFGKNGESGYNTNAVDGYGHGFGGGSACIGASQSAKNGTAGGKGICWVLEFY